MNARNVSVSLFGLVFLVSACSSSGAAEPAAVERPAESAEQRSAQPSSEPVEGEYGSDPRFDKLYDQCESGNDEACGILYWESPPGSEYEAFAYSEMPDSVGDESWAVEGEYDTGPISTQPFEEASPDDVAAALNDAGISAKVGEPEGGNITGSFEGYTIYLNGDEYGWEGIVSLDRYSAESVLEDAIGQHQYGVGDSLIAHVYGDGIVSIYEGSRPEHLESYEVAMDALGAQLVADHR